MTAKAISIRLPWPWAILRLPRDIAKLIENRSQGTSYRGRLYIHVPQQDSDREGRKWFQQIIDRLGDRAETALDGLTYDTAARGCIVGAVDLVDVVSPEEVEPGQKKWASGPCCYKLDNPVLFSESVPCTGKLGVYSIPDDVAARCEQLYRAAGGVVVADESAAADEAVDVEEVAMAKKGSAGALAGGYVDPNTGEQIDPVRAGVVLRLSGPIAELRMEVAVLESRKKELSSQIKAEKEKLARWVFASDQARASESWTPDLFDEVSAELAGEEEEQ